MTSRRPRGDCGGGTAPVKGGRPLGGGRGINICYTSDLGQNCYKRGTANPITI